MSVYSGCKNNFYITNYKKEYDSSEYARSICQDKLDGFMLVKTNPLEMLLYNRDGSIASMCGNGIRCFINYCYDHNLLDDDVNIVKTPSGDIYTKIESVAPFLVKLHITKPHYIYIDGKEYLNELIEVNNHKYYISLVNTGVWHGIIIPDNFDECISDAKDIHNLKLFKDLLNVDIVKITDNKVFLKTYERGIGFTKACGTGTAATYVILSKMGLIKNNEEEIHQEGGIVSAGVDDGNIYIIGPSICEE